jgi:SAM-dependent methyltransferase
MSDADRLKWNARYREEAPPRAVSAVVRAVEDLLPRRGRALDVAGGAGRHAVWLAQRGLTVTLADVADEGLERAREAAAGAAVAVETVAVDLEAAPLPAGPWDLILCFHYLHRPLFASFAASLAPGGVLVAVQPTLANLARHPKPGAAFLLAEGEMRGLVAPLAIVQYDEGWLEEGRHEARVVARWVAERCDVDGHHEGGRVVAGP